MLNNNTGELVSILGLHFEWYRQIKSAKCGPDYDAASGTIAKAVSIVERLKPSLKKEDFEITPLMRLFRLEPDNFLRRVAEAYYGWENIEVVAFSGKQGAGKTSAQNKLKSHCSETKYAYQIHELNFADPIHESNDYVLNRMKSKYGIEHNYVKNRKYMQFFGTDFGRGEFGKNVWIDVLKNRISEINARNPLDGKKHLVIIGDQRFQNEFDAIPQAFRVRLQCHEAKRRVRAAKWGDVTHNSEIGLDMYANAGKFDLYVDTDFESLEDGLNHVNSLVMSRLKRKEWDSRRDRKPEQPIFLEEIFENVDYNAI